MTVEVQLKINNDPRLKAFIREYPIWYKKLNRDPSLFQDFVNDMKNKYKLTTSDRISRVLDNIGMLEAFINVLK